jgi:hypothetical protein
MASILTFNSSPSYTPYLAIIRVHNFCQSNGARFNLMYQSFAFLHRLSLAILNSFFSSYFRTSIAIYSLSAQSNTPSKSFPQNNSSIPFGLVILLLFHLILRCGKYLFQVLSFLYFIYFLWPNNSYSIFFYLHIKIYITPTHKSLT